MNDDPPEPLRGAIGCGAVARNPGNGPLPDRLPFDRLAAELLISAEARLTGEGRAVIHACLDLRCALEALTFETLQSYDDHVGPRLIEANDTWRPVRVFERLAKYDEHVGLPLIVRMTLTVDGQSAETFDLVEERLSAEWATEAHQALSKVLHHPTAAQLRAGGEVDLGAARRLAEAVMGRLKAILASPARNLQDEVRFGYKCPDCDSDVSVAVVALARGLARTRCSGCNAEWRLGPGRPQPTFTRAKG
jgi:hypothetical protein